MLNYENKLEDEVFMKNIEVCCAVIMRNHNERKEVFATARGYGDYKGWWEFPGGKVEKNETLEECIIREINEELSVKINPLKKLETVEYDYPNFHLTMHCFLCRIVSGEIKLLEAEDAEWLTEENLYSVKWLPADEKILDSIFD